MEKDKPKKRGRPPKIGRPKIEPIGLINKKSVIPVTCPNCGQQLEIKFNVDQLGVYAEIYRIDRERINNLEIDFEGP